MALAETAILMILLSPAKKLDYLSPFTSINHTQARCLVDSQVLVEQLKTYAPQQLAELMHLSDELAQLNFERYAQWQLAGNLDHAKPAMFAFAGDVYAGLAALDLDLPTLNYAQEHLRILSGLYGLLRPFDLIQPYRLEMGTALKTTRGKNLYEFWGKKLTKILDADLQALGEASLLNLASHEYAKAIQVNALNNLVISPIFKDWSKGQYRVISFFAKRARGLMARFVLEQRITRLEDILEFADEAYVYDPSLTQHPHQPVFTRKAF